MAHISLPETVSVVENYKIVFDNAGGNSSLAKVKFQTKNQAIDYQLYIGSGNYKRQKLKAYILLESLAALALLATITILVLGEMDKSRQQMQDSLHQQEVLNVATMAVQTGQDDLVMNGVEIHIIRRDGELYVYDGQKEVMHVKKN